MCDSLRRFKSGVFQALAHPTRIAIVELLRDEREVPVSRIHERLGLEQANGRIDNMGRNIDSRVNQGHNPPPEGAALHRRLDTIRQESHDMAAQHNGGLSGDEQLREELRQKGYQRARQYTWSASAGKMLSVYQKLYAGAINFADEVAPA